jgi:hypothetical protein
LSNAFFNPAEKDDFSNAFVVLNNGLKTNPGSLLLAKELAFTY